MNKHLFLASALFAAAPVALLVPGCGGGNGGIVTPTSTPTTTPPTNTPAGNATNTPISNATNTPIPKTATPVPTPKVGTANISFTARNGAYFGTSPYSADGVTADDQNNTDLSIGFATVFSGSDARYFTLSLHHAGAIQNGQTFSLSSGGSSLIASAPVSAGSLDYVSYGTAGFTMGTATTTRSGNNATFILKNVVVRNNDATVGSPNASLTFNANITVTLPPSAR